MAEKELKPKRYVMSGGLVSKDLSFIALDVLELTDKQLENPKVKAKAIELIPENIKKYKIPAEIINK